MKKTDRSENKSIPIEEIVRFNTNFRILKVCLESFGNKLDINTNQVVNLKTEIKKQTELDEKNQKFLHDIVKQLIDDRTLETKEAVSLKKESAKRKMEERSAIMKNLGNIFNWAVKIGILILVGILGLKQFLP
jgi:hypothetical protein